MSKLYFLRIKQLGGNNNLTSRLQFGGSPAFCQGYTLDSLANWSSFNNNGSTESRTHSSTNEVTARGATSLTYDANGNLTDDGNQKYIWDELNRLIQVKDSGNNLIVDYYYNVDNLRVEKHHVGGAKEQFYYCDKFVVEDQDGSQSLTREYMQGGQYIDEVIAVKTGGNYYYYLYDLRFNEYGFVDSSGAVVERARYDGYGKQTLTDPSYNTITTPVVDQTYGYTGRNHDSETGLQYYRARYFDNSLGRFINRDPIGYKDGMNLYRGYFIPKSNDPFGLADVALDGSLSTWVSTWADSDDDNDGTPNGEDDSAYTYDDAVNDEIESMNEFNLNFNLDLEEDLINFSMFNLSNTDNSLCPCEEDSEESGESVEPPDLPGGSGGSVSVYIPPYEWPPSNPLEPFLEPFNVMFDSLFNLHPTSPGVWSNSSENFNFGVLSLTEYFSEWEPGVVPVILDDPNPTMFKKTTKCFGIEWLF